ncbi:MAG: MBL fold metallo-hydrolase [Clostridiales bacterium]|nr:MBL fold metallo-hydrolase [Clostridiales bacterium]
MRKIYSFLIFLTVLLAGSVMAFAVNINIDGKGVEFNEVYGEPFIDAANRTQVPLRITMESCGCEVNWDDARKTALVEKDGILVEVPVGSSYILVNGVKRQNDTVAVIKDSRTYLPIRAVLEAFGAKVDWDPSTQTVIVTMEGDSETAVEKKNLTVHFIDVGQADAIFLDYGTTEILVDGGNNKDGDTVSAYIKPYVDYSLDYIIATHPDADHVGGLDIVINDYEVDQIIDSGFIKNTATANSYYNAAAAEGCEFIYDKDMTINIGGAVTVKIIETGDNYESANDNSVIALVSYGDFKLLLTGDMGSTVEEKNLNKFSDVDVLKVGHHGSRYSTSAAFLRTVKPEAAVVSAGIGNSYDHPHKETLQRLLDRGTKVYGTSKSGNVVLTTSGSGYSFSTNKTMNIGDAGDFYVSDGNTDVTVTQYVGNANSKKFHLSTCTYAEKISLGNRVNISTREEAVNKGYEACKICRP